MLPNLHFRTFFYCVYPNTKLYLLYNCRKLTERTFDLTVPSNLILVCLGRISFAVDQLNWLLLEKNIVLILKFRRDEQKLYYQEARYIDFKRKQYGFTFFNFMAAITNCSIVESLALTPTFFVSNIMRPV